MKLISSGAVLALLIVVAVILRATLGMATVFLFLAALALLVAIYFVWSSFEVGSDRRKMSFTEALSFAMPTLAEEQKVAILRALKDLEYEREVGKITDEDYKTVLAEYRARAKASIVTADESLALGRETALHWAKEAEKQTAESEAEDSEKSEAAEPSTSELPSEAGEPSTETAKPQAAANDEAGKA